MSKHVGEKCGIQRPVWRRAYKMQLQSKLVMVSQCRYDGITDKRTHKQFDIRIDGLSVYRMTRSFSGKEHKNVNISSLCPKINILVLFKSFFSNYCYMY